MEKWEKYKFQPFLCNKLMLEVYEKIISNEIITSEQEELNILYDYLFKVEVWGYYELRLYNSTMLLMNTEMVLTLSKTAYEKSTRYHKLKKINHVIVPILINTLIHLIGPVNLGNEKIQKYKKEADIFFSYLENASIPESSLYERIQLLYIKGIYEIKMGDCKKGIAKANKAIKILSDLGSYDLVNNMESYLGLVLDVNE
ncbi:hypothetical protein ACQKP0_12810 [Heyndrickxia sp. NPDC080065]|uniref:Rgg family transcriptional regulator n=1 Tax=Heyndrickxia sp. NPDC080065 TaxID=3390568 RepID=UPI003D02C806